MIQINIKCDHLLVLFLLGVILLLCRLGLLSADTTWTSTTEWRGKGEVNVLLGVETDDEGWDVDDLLSDTMLVLGSVLQDNSHANIPDMSLLDQDTSVVDGLGKTELVDAGLQTALQEIFNLEGQDVIELHAGLIEHTDTDETANERIAFEESLGVLLVEGKKLTVRA